MARYFIQLAYKGSQYHGWQIQPNAISIQEILETNLSTVLRDNMHVVGCGRTDTGVHASKYFAHFETDQSLPNNLGYKMNSLLPHDIVVHDIFPVDSKMHSRFSAIKRTYKYVIQLEKSPFEQQSSWLCPYPLDIKKMNEAAKYLKGNQNFKAFCKGAEKEEDNSFMCNVFEANWIQQGTQLIFTISANRFLRNMVRAIVGTLVEVGRSRIEPKNIIDIIQSQNRQNSGMSVPADGLYLVDIGY